MPLVIVDAENVRRSQWPNLSHEGSSDARESGPHVKATSYRSSSTARRPRTRRTSCGSRDADDAIVELAAPIDDPWWLVSSDRGLRERVGDGPERVIGGGSFLRSI